MKYDVSEVKASVCYLGFQSITGEEQEKRALSERVIYLICISAKWDLQEWSSNTWYCESCTAFISYQANQFLMTITQSIIFLLSDLYLYPFPFYSTYHSTSPTLLSNKIPPLRREL